MVIFGQSLESILTPFVNIITFGIDIAAGLIIGISAIVGFISFFEDIGDQVTQRANTGQGNHKAALGKGYAACT